MAKHARDIRKPEIRASLTNRSSHHQAHPLSQTTAQLALTLIIGGSNVSGVLGNSLEKGAPLAEETALFEQLLAQAEAKKTGGDALKVRTIIQHLARNFLQAFQDQGIDPARITTIGLSVAGPVNARGEINLTNPIIDFKGVNVARMFCSAFNKLRRRLGATRIEPGDIHTENDGIAGLKGEFLHEKGRLQYSRKGAYLIIGTGVGGAAGTYEAVAGASHSTITPSQEILEFGHTLVRDKDGQYAVWTLETLKERGLFQNGGYVGSPSSAAYFEHRVAGPWFAAHFIRSLASSKELREALVHYVYDALSSPSPDVAKKAFPKKSCDEITRDIQTVLELDERSIETWAKSGKLPAYLQYVTNKYILQTFLNARIEKSDALRERAQFYKREKCIEIGEALSALRHRFSDIGPLVIGSGLGEALLSEPLALQTVREAAGLSAHSRLILVSKMNGRERESAATIHAHIQSLLTQE